MRPIKFQESNMTHTGEGCGDLPTFVNRQGVVSCWRMSWRERVKALFTGKVWLVVWGQGQPPVELRVEMPFDRGGQDCHTQPTADRQ